MSETTSWHGVHTVPIDHMIKVRLGPLTLAVSHRPGEWRLGYTRPGPSADDGAGVSIDPPTPIAELDDPSWAIHRFLTQRTSDVIQLAPRLADRPVVARPDLPLTVPAGDEADLFVSTPIWVHLMLPDPDRALLELPTSRPSDTWFGPSTRHGNVAYAIRTTARRRFGDLPTVNHRAITRVTVRNHAHSALPLERVSVPAPDLHLFADPNDGLWTSALVATRTSESTPARVEIDSGPPAEVAGARRVAEPRELGHQNLFSRAFQVLIG